jgi:hypothetical protein
VSWRRLLWCGAAIAVGWGLFLFLPGKPRWAMPRLETPLYFSSDRLVSAAVDVSKYDGMPVEYGPHARNEIVGPIHLRDMRTGRILSSAALNGEPSLTLAISSDLRYVLAAVHQRSEHCLYDLVTGESWKPGEDSRLEMSPRGSFVAEFRGDNLVRLLDTASRTVLGEMHASQASMQATSDDSWALLYQLRGAPRWLLWRRGQEGLRTGVFPGPVSQVLLASDNRTAGLFCTSPRRLVVWDVLEGAVRAEWRPQGLTDQTYFTIDPTGRHVAAWQAGGAGLALFDSVTGKEASVGEQVGLHRAFAPDGRSFAFIHPTKGVTSIIELPGGRVRTGFSGLHSLTWLNEGDPNRLLMVANSGGQSLVDAFTGQTIVPARHGVLSDDRRCLIRQDAVSLIEANHLPDWLGKWVPQFAKANFLRLRIERATDGEELLRLLRPSEKEMISPVRTPFVTSDTVVLISPDHPAEVWDLPPARRWEWIIGVPAVLAVLPLIVARVKSARRRTPIHGARGASP